MSVPQIVLDTNVNLIVASWTVGAAGLAVRSFHKFSTETPYDAVLLAKAVDSKFPLEKQAQVLEKEWNVNDVRNVPEGVRNRHFPQELVVERLKDLWYVRRKVREGTLLLYVAVVLLKVISISDVYVFLPREYLQDQTVYYIKNVSNDVEVRNWR
eukprot:jgi/Mesvir1/15879/Mv22374-RA.1